MSGAASSASRSSSFPAKHPLRAASPPSCSEADDEASSSPENHSLMGPNEDDADAQRPPARYPGEDTRETSSRELLGFYAYSFAAEVFVVCALGAFIPITLEDLARRSPTAVLAKDHSKPCQPTSPVTGHDTRAPPGTGNDQCVFHVLGAEVNTASFAMYTFSFSVLIQSLLVVTMSGAADHGSYRKTLLLAFAGVGSVATMLFLPVTPSLYLLGSLWAVIGNVCFGASFVLLNSFLPLLVRHHPSTKLDPASPIETLHQNATPHRDHHLRDSFEEAAPLMASDENLAANAIPYPPSSAASSAEMQLSTKISSYGVGIGYIAAAIVQITSIFILQATGANLFSLRLVLFFIGLWWFAFTVPAAFCLRPRPGPPLTLDSNSGKARTWLGYFAYSWKTLWRTVIRARRLKDVLLFLAAWFMISDAIATVSGTAILFAKTELGMSPAQLAFINVTVLVSGITGAFTWSKVSRLLNLKPSQTIFACICLFELIPLYALLGYIPAVRQLGFLGLQQQWEVYPVGLIYGLVIGGLSSYCRSLFGELIPPGSEAAFYALYAITDKGSSIFGPAIVGAITDATGEIRPAFIFLAFLIGLPMPIMFFVDVERGRREGAALARESFRAPASFDATRSRQESEHLYQD